MKLTKITYEVGARIISQFFNSDVETAKQNNDWLKEFNIISFESNVEIEVTDKDYFDKGGMLCSKETSQNPNEDDKMKINFDYRATSI